MDFVMKGCYILKVKDLRETSLGIEHSFHGFRQ